VDDSFDLVVVGSGIAGLYTALRAVEARLRVLLVTKGALEESNTRYAQGGIAAALGPHDSPELHLRDTVAAGDGLCDPENVAILTRDAPDCIVDLLRLGVPFDRDGGEFDWTLEAAHSLPRVLHAGGDATGAGIERTLAGAVRQAGVVVWEHALCTGVDAAGGCVRGVELLLRDDSVASVRAPHVILATGGAGQLFSRTTNPRVATGDGLAAAYRAGAELMDLEFVQFHPTALALDGAPSFLISEAVRGEGGILRDDAGRAFMAGYHPDCELAPRDVVARAIHRQMAVTGSEHVWLDLTHLDVGRVERRFPSIVSFCRLHGVDPVTGPIPVAPAAHYIMGGIRTDSWARTTLSGLFACGEAACTGAHGANRLASNSLLEGLVFARRAVTCIRAEHDSLGDRSVARNGVPRYGSERGPLPLGAAFRNSLGHIMWEDAGLVRSAESLKRAVSRIEAATFDSGDSNPGRREQYEADNLHLLAQLVVECATFREESRGAHFRSDFPGRDAGWQRHTVISREVIGLAPVASGGGWVSAAHE
jgi:L-aspartate oxidase